MTIDQATEEQATTGRLGEEAVYLHYKSRFEENYLLEMSAGNDFLSHVTSVEWVNSSCETGLPYDIVLQRKEGFSDVYIEVKTTRVNPGDKKVRDWWIARDILYLLHLSFFLSPLLYMYMC